MKQKYFKQKLITPTTKIQMKFYLIAFLGLLTLGASEFHLVETEGSSPNIETEGKRAQ